MAFLRMPRGKDEPKALGELGAKPFRGGEETRAKGAKLKGMEDEEMGGGVEEWVFGLDKELGAGLVGNFMIKRAD